MDIKKNISTAIAYLNKRVDKVLHYLVCFAVTMTINYFGGCSRWWLSFAFVALISIGKEVFDEWLYKGFSLGDLAADFAGCASAMAICFIGVLVC